MMIPTPRILLGLALLLSASFPACSGGSEGSESPNASDAGSADGQSGDAGEGPTQLTSQYSDPRRVVEFISTGKSCAQVCAGQTSGGRCAAEGDSDSEVGSGDDWMDCFRRADYYIPRSHYENDSETRFSSDHLECNDIPENEDTFNGYDLYAIECCCMQRQPQWLANDLDSPRTCNEVCEERGLECGSYDMCRMIPGLCSESFPEFFVQSIARYGDDGDGTGKETYPACGEVPASAFLESHSCSCL